jgi:hypothetical protein
MELQYIRTCRNQAENGIEGKLRRFEFIEYMVRLGISAHSGKLAPSLALLISIELFLKPVYNESTFLHERELIRASRPLNKLLYENRHGLGFIYDRLKANQPMLSKKNSNAFIQELLTKQYPEFTILEIHKHFVYSLETVADEHCDFEKYQFLNYIEFLEFICRIAGKLYEERKEEGLD